MGSSGRRGQAKRARRSSLMPGDAPPETRRLRGRQTNQLLPGEGYIEGTERVAEAVHHGHRRPRPKMTPRRVAILVWTLLAFFAGPTLVVLIVYLITKH